MRQFAKLKNDPERDARAEQRDETRLEPICVVDDNNGILGFFEASIVTAQNLTHRALGLILLDETGTFYFGFDSCNRLTLPIIEPENTLATLDLASFALKKKGLTAKKITLAKKVRFKQCFLTVFTVHLLPGQNLSAFFPVAHKMYASLVRQNDFASELLLHLTLAGVFESYGTLQPN